MSETQHKNPYEESYERLLPYAGQGNINHTLETLSAQVEAYDRALQDMAAEREAVERLASAAEDLIGQGQAGHVLDKWDAFEKALAAYRQAQTGRQA